jgi:hypothetical protein
MPNFAGPSPADIRLWNTYLYWARAELAPTTTRVLRIGSLQNRIHPRRAQALRAIVLAAFVLEYRVKRVYDELGVAYGPKDPLGALLDNMTARLQARSRLDGRGLIRLPRTWPALHTKLLSLKDLRNDIAHAKYVKLRSLLPLSPARMLRRAQTHFNVVMRALKVLNIATGYDTQTPAQRRLNYDSLRVRRVEGA